jgi:hypothetical protein
MPKPSLTENVWVKRDAAAYPASPYYPNKHIKAEYCPLDSKVYLIGGDHYGDGGMNSREMIYSYDISTDTWVNVLSYAQSGTAGFPAGRCMPGWTWDNRRNVFWFQAGQLRQIEEGGYRPGLVMGGLWTYDPAAALADRWHLEGPDVPNYWTHLAGATSSANLPVAQGSQDRECWYTLYDYNTDALYAPYIADNNQGYMAKYSLSGITIKNHVSKDNWSYTSITGPSPYLGARAFCLDSLRNQFIIYFPWPGAPVEADRGETWQFTPPNTWLKLDSTDLTPHAAYGMVYDPKHDRVVMLCGYATHEGGSGPYLNSVYVLDRADNATNRNTWGQINCTGNVPSIRKGETAVYDIDNDCIMQLGGTGGFQSIGVPDAGGYLGSEVFLLRVGLPETVTASYDLATESNTGMSGAIAWESVFKTNDGLIASFGTGNHAPEESNAMRIIDPVTIPGHITTYDMFPWTQSGGTNLYVSNYDNHASLYIPTSGTEGVVIWVGHGLFDFSTGAWTYGDRNPLLANPLSNFISGTTGLTNYYNPAVAQNS